MQNVLKTYLLLGALTALLLIMGSMLGGPNGVIVALVISLVFNIVTFWFSDKIVLSMYRAQEIYPNHPSGLFEMIEKLARRAGLPTPRVYIVPNQAPNAFATGRGPNNAAVAATEGLLEMLTYDEIEAVMAHEISHVKNRDTLISTLTAVIASAIMHIVAIARWAMIFGIGGRDSDGDSEGGLLGTVLMLILAPVAAVLIQAAVSRSREYMADQGSKSLVGSGVPLSNALRRIESYSSRGRNILKASPETSHMFIINPVTGKSVMALFSTHPATEDRIERLLYG
ncbi:MAG: zinc metalloprotease HtpX [Oligoflexia bacterium]|nr:zinc metalloprotease HtpX [Oligoflexia bacterium]